MTENSRPLGAVPMETCNKLTITGPEVYASSTVSYLPNKWHLELTSTLMCRTAKGTNESRGQFGNISDIFGRFGYLRFITREKTSDRIAFMKFWTGIAGAGCQNLKNLQQPFFLLRI